MSRSVTGQSVRQLVEPWLSGARRTGATWWYLALAVGGFVLLTSLQFLRGQRTVADFAIAAIVGALTAFAAFDARASARAAARQQDASETFARILSALSRSVSPDAIVDAIVEELGAATHADHIGIVRLRSDESALEATLVSTRAGTPTSNSQLSARLLEPPNAHRGSHRRSGGDGADSPPLRGSPNEAPATAGSTAAEIAERIAYRLRLDYGLHNTLAAPLWTDDRVIGAIVLSRRIEDGWPDPAARLLENAATETSAALSRVYSHHVAEMEARTDQLTRLPNRRYFDEWCSLVAERRRATDHLAILEIDVDNFKLFNDQFGHQVGDEVLKAIGAAIQASVRDEDVPARYGGEEFVVLLRNPAPGVPAEVGERIRLAVRDLDLSELGVPGVSVSVGVAAAAGPQETIAGVIERADRALYAAKHAGRNCVIESVAMPILDGQDWPERVPQPKSFE